jgi:hypothetical protein
MALLTVASLSGAIVLKCIGDLLRWLRNQNAPFTCLGHLEYYVSDVIVPRWHRGLIGRELC